MEKPAWLKCSVSHGKVIRPAVCGIYVITAPGGEAYVGSSKDCYKRWSSHNGKLRCHEHWALGLQTAVALYGEAGLTFEVVEEVPKALLLEAEQRWIDKLKAEGRLVLNQEPAAGIAQNTSNNHLQPKRVRGTHLKTGEVIEFPSTAEAGRKGFNHRAVSDACRGVRNAHRKHGGTSTYKDYHWKYID